MKSIQSIIIPIILLNLSGCGQNKNEASEIENLLTEFYTSYLHIWTDIPPQPYQIKRNKLDSLIQKYCTRNLRDSAKEYLQSGQDLLTNDLGSVKLNENLRVERNLSKENEYIVSFDATYYVPGGSIVKQVVLHVTVIKKGNFYKIDSVK